MQDGIGIPEMDLDAIVIQQSVEEITKEGGPSRALQIAGIKQFHLHAHKEQHLIRVPLDYFSRLKKALINKSQEVSFRALTFSP